MTIIINMNTFCSFTLTRTGADIYRSFHVFSAYPPTTYPEPGETLSMPLWELLQVFGPHQHHGAKPFAVGNTITIGEKI